jgi:hypothetical protein
VTQTTTQKRHVWITIGDTEYGLGDAPYSGSADGTPHYVLVPPDGRHIAGPWSFIVAAAAKFPGLAQEVEEVLRAWTRGESGETTP